MRFRLFLVVLFFLPHILNGQTPATSAGVKFYSEGPIYVKYGAITTGDSTSTTLYIQGSAEFANGAGIVQHGRTEITEDFINSMDPDFISVYPNLFTSEEGATAKPNGIVAFVGANNKQYIKRSDKLTLIAGVDKPKQKALNYIAFPTISIEKVNKDPYLDGSLDPRKYNYLAVDSSAAIMVDKLLVPKYNRLAIEGGYSLSDPSKLNVGQALLTAVNAESESSYSQVNLKMYNYKKNEINENLFNSDHEGVNGDNTVLNAGEENYMTGFTPPFEELGADYFFYHTLTKPSASSFNSWAGNIVDPYTTLKRGYGYFMSMDVTDFDHKDNINPRWAHDMGADGDANRARGGFVFNRAIMADYLGQGYSVDDNNVKDNNQKGFSRFVYPDGTLQPFEGTAALEYRDKKVETNKERFVLDDVTVDLKAGFNFLGNPFMAPISLNYLLGLQYKDITTGKVYGEVASMDDPVNLEDNLFGGNVKVSSVYVDPDVNMLRAKYWIINKASVRYHNSDGLMHFKATYDYISRQGGSTGAVFKTQSASGGSDQDAPTSIAPQDYLIAPMQMFGLQANKDFPITLSAKLRTFGTTRFQKSTSSATDDLVKDYLIVEVVSPVEKTSDRTAVVMRENAKLTYAADPYDTRKGISKEMETYVDKDAEGKNRTYPEPSTSIVYTKSADGENLLGNGVPLRTKEVPLYVTPPVVQQTMTLNFYNLENMKAVPNVWLIDRYENKTVKLTEGYSYNFSSGPSDQNNLENRFILRFWGDDEDIIKDESKISCYYNTSILHISGLNQDDINSDLQIYDMQGRLIGKTRVNNAPSMEYLKPLSLGTYVVKITGKRNYTSKFVNLHN